VAEENQFKRGSEFEIKADMVIKALGFDPEDFQLYLILKNYKLQNGEQ
jgi:NADPH-dependent glutamate synthase beta subunit-like oxidoreductase